MIKILIATALALAAGGVCAHEHEKHEEEAAPSTSTEETPFGREGDAGKASRTIDIGMSDKLRFTPGELTVKRGETVRFRVKNSGQVMHEMVLGTLQDLKEHAEMMRKHPAMKHDAPYMAHVAPGETATMVWQFTKAGEFHYGCLVPGHFEAGMIGKVVVK
jgi:uncharacterized cupredoxin-like copper-binding protein